MLNTSKITLGLVTLVLAGAPLAAADLSYGGQVTASLPTGAYSGKDWMDGHVGGGVGAHMVIGFEGGHAIVPRLDFTYDKKDNGGVTAKTYMYQLGADYNYFLSRHVNEGPYVGGGAGLGVTKFKLDGLGYSTDDTPVSPYVAASAGWMFTKNLGAELRYTYSRYKPDVAGFTPRGYDGKPTVDTGTLNASFIFRM